MSEADNLSNSTQPVEPASHSLPVNFNWKIAPESHPAPPPEPPAVPEPLVEPGEVEDIVSLAQKLQGRDRNLLEHGAQLEQIIKECQQVLQVQIARSQAQETLFAQQEAELNAAQEQVSRLFRELESAHQTTQRQQALIENLNQQLDASQQRVAQLERECALVQQQCNEREQELFQAQTLNKELRSRLYREQRHALQFKAALDKCLEPQAINWGETGEEETAPANPVLPHIAPFPKTQPIQPWSSQAELSPETRHLLKLPPVEANNPAPVPDFAAREQEIASLLAERPNLAKVFQPALNQPDAEAAADAAPEVPEASDRSEVAPSTPEPTSEPAAKDESSNPQSQWPVPIVYPQRPTTGRKSLAAVELPNFPKIATSSPAASTQTQS